MIDIKLPITYETAVTSSNRITVPKWISYVEVGDRIEGYVQLIDQETKYPYDKKVSSTRHITIGFLRTSLPDKKLPPRLKITIEKVHKTISDGLDFNLVTYKSDNGAYLMNFSTAKPEPGIQFRLDIFTEDFVTEYFKTNKTTDNQILDPFYYDEEKKWLIPIFILTTDEMGVAIPVILYLVMSQEYYQKYNDTSEKISKLVLRMSNWVFSINDFNIETLSKLSSQINDILDKQIEPEYLEMKAILQLPKLEREILLVILKEHRNGGITLQNLADQVRINQKTVLEKSEELIKKGILRKFEDNDQIVIDSLWVV